MAWYALQINSLRRKHNKYLLLFLNKLRTLYITKYDKLSKDAQDQKKKNIWNYIRSLTVLAIHKNFEEELLLKSMMN